ncbi:hypothetical protein psyc5s11_32470 [Clostridium gelidum]|uniref:DUF4825 domain-containing protein n=1 Tax=Clostridium gelidum TaxID=704125 RepID=A0ABM7T7E3_9CLOT|nr:hypothetical protein [Clostridium gelidum]BCZ47180.1 hypothetical protein psyc5s11_32470 [Clostridium gelidum]
MIERKKVVRNIVIVFMITLLFFIVGTPRYQSMKIKSEGFSDLENKLKETVFDNSEIDIKKLTNFDWDECYVFNPYYPSKEVYEKVGVEWTNTKTFIGFLMIHDVENETSNDDQFLIVFKKENKVVLAKIYSLNELPVILKLEDNKFTSSNAKFLVTVSKQYDEGKIKELVLKN